MRRPWSRATSSTSASAPSFPPTFASSQADMSTIDQAALTGESLPVAKKLGEEAYSGSVVKQGEMDARRDRHRRQHVLRAHRQARRRRRGNEPHAEGDAADRKLPDRARRGSCLDHGRRCASIAKSSSPTHWGLGGCIEHPAIRVDPADCFDPGCDAGGVLDHHGAGRARPLQAEGDRLPARRRSRRWPASISSARTRPAR